MPKIKVRLSTESIGNAIREVNSYRKRVETAAEKIAKGLADMGFEVALEIINAHYFSGATAESLTCLQKGPGKYVIYAASEAILFLEFGAGARSGYGHPLAGKFGYGPGTYPGSTHWNDPAGWWYPTDDPRLIIRTDKDGQGWGHSYGNPPYKPFYLADVKMRDNILRVAKEALQL